MPSLSSFWRRKPGARLSTQKRRDPFVAAPRIQSREDDEEAGLGQRWSIEELCPFKGRSRLAFSALICRARR